MITLTKKKSKSSNDLYAEVKKQLDKDILNIESVRDFVDNWRDCFSDQRELEPLITNMELRILQALQSYWGKGSFVEIDRENMRIECYGADGRKATI